MLEGAGALAGDVLAPLNRVGDQTGVSLKDGVVTTPPGFKDAYQAFIGGGWQGRGDPERGGVETVSENLIGNLRLARWTIPALAQARAARIWLGLEAETADAMPIIGPLPGVRDAYVIGSVHSGYTSGPYMGRLLADLVLGREPERPLFDPARLVGVPMPAHS